MAEEYILEPEKKIPIIRDVDLIVIGGSQSGVAAAVAAKRANPDIKVLIVEQYGYLGGQSVGCLVVHWEFREYTNNKGQVIAKGIGKEMIRRIVEKGHSDPMYKEWLEGRGPPFEEYPDPRAHADIPLDVNDIKLVLIEMCDETGVEVLLNSRVVAALPLDNSTKYPASRGAFVETIDGRFAIKANMIVDCSANADMAWFVGGHDAVIIPETQAMGMQAYVWIENVDLEAFVKECLWKGSGFQKFYPKNDQQLLDHVHQGKTFVIKGFADYIDEAYENEPELLERYQETSAVPQIYFWLKPVKIRKVEIEGKAKYLGTFAIEGPVFMWKQVDPFLVSRAALNQVKAADVSARMHRYLPGWQDSLLDRTVNRLGYRQTRIPRGLYALTAEDVWKHRQFEDVIGRGSGHDIGRDNFDAEFGYDIPYRSIIPEKIDGLLFGARSICTEGDDKDEALTALNAHRGISATIIVSQAAGIAAALCLKDGVEPRDLDVKKLQAELRKQDVVLDQPST